jgi:hypothetical protein
MKWRYSEGVKVLYDMVAAASYQKMRKQPVCSSTGSLLQLIACPSGVTAE